MRRDVWLGSHALAPHCNLALTHGEVAVQRRVPVGAVRGAVAAQHQASQGRHGAAGARAGPGPVPVAVADGGQRAPRAAVHGERHGAPGEGLCFQAPHAGRAPRLGHALRAHAPRRQRGHGAVRVTAECGIRPEGVLRTPLSPPRVLPRGAAGIR